LNGSDDYSLNQDEINEFIDSLQNKNIQISTNSSFIIAQHLNQDSNITIRGVSFNRKTGGQIIDTSNKNKIINSDLSAAAIVSHESINYSSNKKIGVTYFCSLYDTKNSKWNESGCTAPHYNKQYDRYECTCNHLTKFALLWLPKISQPNYLTPQDIASLIFLSFSILCFIAVIIHSLTVRLLNPMMSFKPRDLLPLISSATTTSLFIFYIALTMTIYTRISSLPLTSTACFTSASILMFITYFLLIFMFCVRTSVGYFNYLRFVQLFPEPSHRMLFIMVILSLLISITSTAFAVGFNSNSSYNITQMHDNKLCWFTRDVIYYFTTIPVCIFLLLNLITIIVVAKHIINHIQRATSPHQSYERMKRCVLVVLSSCVTQGLGWLFGPFITFVNPTAGNVLGWFFIIFNGLEGVWAILLYTIIRSQRLDESRRGRTKHKWFK
jgi:hypothetical protein